MAFDDKLILAVYEMAIQKENSPMFSRTGTSIFYKVVEPCKGDTFIGSQLVRLQSPLLH